MCVCVCEFGNARLLYECVCTAMPIPRTIDAIINKNKNDFVNAHNMRMKICRFQQYANPMPSINSMFFSPFHAKNNKNEQIIKLQGVNW